jgi:hypothetical protein
LAITGRFLVHLEAAVPLPLAGAPFRDALEVARSATFSNEEWDAYERAKMAEQDARGALSLLRACVRFGHVTHGLDRDALGVGRETRSVLGHDRHFARSEGRPRERGKPKRSSSSFARVASRSEAEQARILACTDAAVLDGWLRAALTASTTADLLE